MGSRFLIVIKLKKQRFKKNRNFEKELNRDIISYEELSRNIYNYFKNRRKRYDIFPDFQLLYYQKNIKNDLKYSESTNNIPLTYSYMICDNKTRNKVQLSIEPKDNNIILYPYKKCTGKTLRDICNGINKVERSIESIEPLKYIY